MFSMFYFLFFVVFTLNLQLFLFRRCFQPFVYFHNLFMSIIYIFYNYKVIFKGYNSAKIASILLTQFHVSKPPDCQSSNITNLRIHKNPYFYNNIKCLYCLFFVSNKLPIEIFVVFQFRYYT